MGAALAWEVDALGEALQPEQHGSLATIDRGTMPGQHLHLWHRALHQRAMPQVLREQRVDLALLLVRGEPHERAARLYEPGHALHDLVV
jgi:hypothetical protein